MIRLNVRGSTERTEALLRRNKQLNIVGLDSLGVQGVNALAEATPMNTGVTASSWDDKLIEEDGKTRLVFVNNNVVDGWFNVALMLQYGHYTRDGCYVTGQDYINPAIQPIFDEVASKIWRTVTEG